MESPLHHFEVHTIIPIHIGGLDLSVNNAVVAMWVGLAIVAGAFMLVVNRGVSPIPGKLQSILEVALEFIRGMVFEFIGEEEGKKYVPFIATLFLFILACNLIGLVPGSYTITSQVVVTGAFAIGIFILINLPLHHDLPRLGIRQWRFGSLGNILPGCSQFLLIISPQQILNGTQIRIINRIRRLLGSCSLPKCCKKMQGTKKSNQNPSGHGSILPWASHLGKPALQLRKRARRGWISCTP